MSETRVRGIRGAVTVEENTVGEILAATRELLLTIIRENALATEDMASILFTVTGDLDAVYPAAAAREIGLTDVPLLCCREIPVPEGLPRCIRVLLHVNTARGQAEIRHIYLREAKRLRPDLTPAPDRG